MMHGNGQHFARKTRRRNFQQIFGIPIAIGAVSTIGLVAALVGDGLLDAVSWTTLAVPLAIILWAFARRN